jgi:Tol biopolymer transport system component
MAKDPADRCQSSAELARNLKRLKHESSRQRVSRVTASRPAYAHSAGAGAPGSPAAATAHTRLLPWISGALALVSTAAAAFLFFRPAPPPALSIQAFVTAPAGTMFHSYGNSSGPVMVSPDGRMLAFVAATAEGRSALYLRPLDAGAALLLPGTEGAYYPFWSHDSKWVAFFSLATGKLKKVDIQGNPPVTICDAFNGRGGSWGSDDVIVFAPEATGPLAAVPASGGTPRQLMPIDTARSESSQRWPCFLPDGRHFLYFSRTASYSAEAEGDAIMAASLDGGPPATVVSSSANAQFASGYLLYMRGSSLLAQRFDESSLAVTGDAMAVAEGVINDAGFSLGVFSASQNGIMAYQTGVGVAGARMVILDREGKELGFVGDVIEHFWPRISPDGSRVVLGIFEPKSRTQNLWMYDIARGSRTRFTTGLSIDYNPVWSPDGRRIAHGANRAGTITVPVRPAAGGGTDEVALESIAPVSTSDWSPDGSALCLNRRGEKTQTDIWILPLDGDKKPRVFVQTAYNESGGRFSPDGRWIAYVSDETGQEEVFIRPYPGPGTALKVSDAGGRAPAWRRDGRELFYVSADNRTMAVEIRSNGPAIEAGTTRTLFTRTPLMSEYDPFPDGKRFLVNRLIEPKETDPITLVTNWTEKIRK